ncbi:PREDICTED: protein AKNAD1 [Elephantulus edwardii]|uniref:protein AKNAD1 n=1 Tax=Elephantulus edwardii TaxID=28737 RepID=UPI0003F0D667|nr:PREDICTED: protein AKNAD1 [Elephantulus edwardii]
MDEAYFAEDRTSKEEVDFIYDKNVPHIVLCNDFTSETDIYDAPHQMFLALHGPPKKAIRKKTCKTVDMAMILDKLTENAASKKHDKQCTIVLHIPPNKENTSKSNISDILLNHLSKKEFFKNQGIDCETLPDILNARCFDDAIIKNIFFYVKNSWPKEQISELEDILNPKEDDDNSSPSCSPTAVEENIFDLDEPVVAGRSSIQDNLHFLKKSQHSRDEHKSFQGQASQNQQPRKSGFRTGFKYDHSQVHYQLSDFSKVASIVKIPKDNIMNKPLIVARRVKSSPSFRNIPPALVQDLSEEAMPRLICVEKHDQEPKMGNFETSQHIQVEPAEHVNQDLLTGLDSESDLFNLSSSQEDSSSSSKILEKISKGKQMCQKLREQTDQLKAKVQEFAKRIAQDSPCSQNRELVLEKMQGHLGLLEQEFLATKEKHLTLQQRDPKDKSPDVSAFGPESKVESEIFKLEMLLGDVEEKIGERKHTSLPLPAVDSVIVQGDVVSVSPPPSNEITKEHPVHPAEPLNMWRTDAMGVTPAELKSEEPREVDREIYLNWPSRGAAAQYLPDQTSSWLSSVSREDLNEALGGQDRAETKALSPSCASCCQALERKQRMERRGHRKFSCGRFSIIIQENPLYLCSTCSSVAGNSSYSDSGMGLQSNRCENCGTKIPNSSKAINKDVFKACSKPKRIGSQGANSKSPQDECEPMPRKDLTALGTSGSNLTTPSPRSPSRRIYGSKSLSDFRNTDKMESEVLNSALEHALRTASILKETTDQMIKAIANDLTKAQKWRSRLKR